MQFNAQMGQAAYQQGQVTSASPLRIVILLYEGAIRFIREAEKRFDEPSVRGQSLGRAHRIISELLAALDHDQGGEIATNLDSLYHFVLDEITRANVQSDVVALRSTLDVLQTLLTAWRDVDEQGLSGRNSCRRTSSSRTSSSRTSISRISIRRTSIRRTSISEPRSSEPRSSESRSAEPRLAEPRSPEPRSFEPRLSE